VKTLIWNITPLLVAIHRERDSCLDIILEWMKARGHENSDETWLVHLQRAMLLGLQRTYPLTPPFLIYILSTTLYLITMKALTLHYPYTGGSN
jgi:hypothetical protein